MSGGAEPISHGPEAVPEGEPDAAFAWKEKEDRASKRRRYFRYFCGWSTFCAGWILWKAWQWPEFRLLAWGNMVATGLFCLATHKMLQTAERAAVPLPWMRSWVRIGLFVMIGGVVNGAAAVAGPFLGERLIPWPSRKEYTDEALFVSESERVNAAWDFLASVIGGWGSTLGLAFLLVSYYFEALPVIRQSKPPPPPPVPREEWWKKYY